MPITYLDDSPKITYLDDAPSPSPMMSAPVQALGQAITQGPSQMLQQIPDLASYAAGKAGDFSQQQLQSQGVDPTTAGAVNKVISAGPNMAMLASGPEAESPEMGAGFMQRALGFSKRFLMTPEGRAAAKQAAQVALENKVMPLLGSPEGAAVNLAALKGATGEALGAVRSSVGPKPIDGVLDSLQTLRTRLTEGGARGGDWDSLHQAIDTAEQTVQGLAQTSENGAVDLNKMARAKKVITEGVNYLKQNVTQDTAKKIGGAIEDGIENILEAHGVDMKAYAALKRTYGGAANALKALNNEIAAQAGNQAINPMSVMAGAGALASGNPALAAEALGTVEFLKRRGTGMAANALNTLGMGTPIPLGAASMGLGLLKTKKQAANDQ